MSNHAVVLGAGPGMGRSLALTYARNGYDLTLVARSEAAMSLIAEEARQSGVAVTTLPLDLSNLEGVDEAISGINDDRPISLLSYNASMHTTSLLEADPGMLRMATDINAHAAVVAIQAALPGLRETGGMVMLTGGGIALKPNAAYGVLALGKSALRGAGLALAEELAPLGVRLRMLTVNGFIRAESSRFNPDTIAAKFWDFANNPEAGVEEIYTGR